MRFSVGHLAVWNGAQFILCCWFWFEQWVYSVLFFILIRVRGRWYINAVSWRVEGHDPTLTEFSIIISLLAEMSKSNTRNTGGPWVKPVRNLISIPHTDLLLRALSTSRIFEQPHWRIKTKFGHWFTNLGLLIVPKDTWDLHGQKY